MRKYALAAAVLVMGCWQSGYAESDKSQLADLRARLPQDEAIYFLLPDRFENADRSNDKGGLHGNRLQTGYDPSSKAFFHGGDLKGVNRRLDYIQSLGMTAIWVAPIFKNKPVQGPEGDESAGYHGYWITDFTKPDPHFGTEADFKALVAAAHAWGMKVYMDIVANHTADVIRYRECPDNVCVYRSRADYPYSRHLGVSGTPINDGFAGDNVVTQENFSHLTRPDYAYTPYIPKGEEKAKVPDWLNDPIYYHNRGNSTFDGESSTMGDFSGLDDLMTENPRVIKGMIEIYAAWIEKYGIDGFRVDTEQHVNPSFWQAFVPAMMKKAAAQGIPNFHIFGEVGMDGVETERTARHSREDGMRYMLDYPFAIAVRQVLAGNGGTDILAKLFADDVLYDGGVETAMRLPTFVSNHDQGRLGYYIRQAFPHASDNEVMKRVILAHAMLFTLRGVPVVYYGDEQGFAGTGGDQASREDMFASKVSLYNSETRIGTHATTVQSSFNPEHPLFVTIENLAKLRQKYTALSRGKQIVRNYAKTPGLFAVSRIDPVDGTEIIIAFNTSTLALTTNVEADPRSISFSGLHGVCPVKPVAPGSLTVTLAPLDFIICKAEVKS